MNRDAWGAYKTNSQIKFKIPMLKPSLCDYSVGYILRKGTIKVVGQRANALPKASNI